MPLKVCDQGERLVLTPLAAWFNSNTFLRLYKNDYTPTDIDTESSFTVADFPGYAAQQMTGWGVPTTVSNKAQIEETVRTFTMSGPTPTNTIYGYYVVDGTGKLLWAERFSSPITMNAMGAQVSILPRFTLKSEF